MYLNIMELFPTFSKFIKFDKCYKIIVASIEIDLNTHVTLWLRVKMIVYHVRDHTSDSFLPTAREGNVLTAVCHSVHNRPHAYSATAHPCWLLSHLLRCGRYAPSGMLSCDY